MPGRSRCQASGVGCQDPNPGCSSLKPEHRSLKPRQGLVGLRRCLAGALVALALAVCCVGEAPVAVGADVLSAPEHEAKAAFVCNFLKFVEWPEGRFPNPSAPLVLGVAGKGPIVTALERMTRERTINGHPLIVRTVETPEDARSVHLLFLHASEDKRLDALLPLLADSSVLTVGESRAFAQAKGIITFVPEGDRLRFEINMNSAERAGLRISAQLQKLATTVRRK